jgi:acyl-CoA thioester hydrolase
MTDVRSPIPDYGLFTFPARVYWEDTDAGGVVYHAQYLAFMERARTEWLRVRGYGQELLRVEYDLVFVVREMQIDFRKPARLDDALRVSVALRECRRASLVLTQTIERDGLRLIDAEVRIAALGALDFKPKSIPPALYREFKAMELAARAPIAG